MQRNHFNFFTSTLQRQNIYPMKKIMFFLICLIITCFACESNDNIALDVELIGDWRLIEIYSDPGDGSGSFTSVNSQKIITFNEDGSITSNGSLCDISITSNNPTSGVYSLIDSTFTTQDCGFDGIAYRFEKTLNTLIISYPCIEGCGSKYIKQ